MLSAEDFEFAEPCVLRPFVEPPEYCKDIIVPKFANRSALSNKSDKHYGRSTKRYFEGSRARTEARAQREGQETSR